MPIINIHIVEGRSEEKINKMIKNVTATVAESLECPQESVRIIVQEMPKNRFAIGGATVQELGR